jgi:chromosome segregation ATPase
MKAQTEQATLDERIVELEKEVEEARATREKAKQEKDSALKSLKAEEIKNLKLINSHKAEVEGHVNAQKVYRENNTKLKEQNEKLTIELAEKEDCIARTKIALVENSDDV